MAAVSCGTTITVTPGAWTVEPPPLVPPMSDHTATLLFDGRVLLVGGTSCARGCGAQDRAIQAAEVYDPALHRWTEIAPPLHVRQYHTATLLMDGRVLVAGGSAAGPDGDSDQISGTAELWSPQTGRWTSTGPMRRPRLGQTATLLVNGKVLVAGGMVPAPPPAGVAWTESTELFDPVTARWSDGPSLSFPRAEHTATLLKDGRVLLAGGRDSHGGNSRIGSALPPDAPPGATLNVHAGLPSAELYDPQTGAMERVSHLLHTGRTNHTATLLGDGTVLIAGGDVSYYHGGFGDPTDSVEIYHPDTDTFTDGPPLPGGRVGHAAVPLRDGRVLIVGGIPAGDKIKYTAQHPAPPELYDPAIPRWTPVTPPPADPSSRSPKRSIEFRLAGNLSLTRFLDARVLALGGDDPSRSAQLVDPTVDTPVVASSDNATRNLAIAIGGGVLAALAVATVAIIVLRRRRRGPPRRLAGAGFR